MASPSPFPIPKFDELSIAQLRTRQSEKWNTYAKDVLPAWVAEMDFPLAAPIHAVLEQTTAIDDLGYPIDPRATGVLEAFAERMADRFDWNIRPGQCEILSDVVQGLYLALYAYHPERSGVVVQTPIYPPFLDAVADTGRRLVDNRLVVGPNGYEIDFDHLRNESADCGVLTLCHPHNPTGRVFSRGELEALAELACQQDWIIVSDEIHEDLLYDGREHIPFARLDPEVAKRTVTLTSATKAFNIPGLRCALAHFGTPELRQQFNTAVPRHIRGGIGLVGLYATIAAWRDSQPWLDAVRPYLEANRDYLLEQLAARFPKIVCQAPQATYLAWLDCRALALPTTPGKHFLRHGRVALSDGHHFGAGLEGYARVNFATSRAILGEVLERMETALDNAAA